MKKRFISINDRELQTLNKILIRCCSSFQKFLDKQSEFEISENSFKLDFTPKGKIQFDVFSILLNLNMNIYPPSYFKKKIDDHLNKDHISDIDTESKSKKKLLNNADLTKIFDILRGKGLIENIRDKDEIKEYRRKTKRKESYKTGGRISYYKTTKEFEEIKEILTNPNAVKYLTDSLNQTAILQDFLKAQFKSTINNIKKTKDLDDLKSSVSLFVQSFNDKSDLNDWNSVIELLSSIDDENLDLILEDVSKEIMQNPIIMQIIYIICGSNLMK